MSGTDQSSPTSDSASERRLAEVIAGHFIGARVVETDGVQVVRLGEGLPVIECSIDGCQDAPPYGVFIFLTIKGGALGESGALVTASGYGPSIEHSLILAGCNWACAFGPVLLTGIGRPDLISTQDPDVEQLETALDGRRYRVAVGHLDRWTGSAEEAAVYRQRLGGPRALTTRVLDSGTVPALRSGQVVALGCFLEAGPTPLAEVKLGAADWPPARAVLDTIPPESGGTRMLREWALLTPIELAPTLTRGGLQRTLDLLRACADNPTSEAGRCGARHHGMRLGETDPGAASLGLPEDMAWFLSTVAAGGAGPGYGLEPRPLAEEWWYLADAGCGAQWVLNLADGTVWLDSRACDDGFQLAAPGFLAWYEAWLDNAICGAGPFARWEYRVDAAYKMLADAAQREGVDELPETVTRVKIHSPQGEPIGPCHACEETCARLGVPSTVFTTAP